MDTTPQQPETGGIGGQPIVDPRTGGQDLRLIRRAILRGWNVPEHIKQLVVDEMGRLVAGKNDQGEPVEVSQRNKIAAARVLVAADSVDARMETADKPTTQVNVNVSNETQINLAGLSDADLEALETMQRKLAPRALTHEAHDGTNGNGTA